MSENTYPVTAELSRRDSQLVIRATLFVAISSALYGLLGLLGTRLLEQNFSISNMLFWRFFVAFLWMLLSALVSGNKKSFQIANGKALFKALLLGSMCYSGGSAFYFLASQRIGTGVAMVIFFSFPIFVVTFAWLIEKKPITFYTISSLIAIVIGMVLLKGIHSHLSSKVGVIFALLASLSYGCYVYGGKYVVKGVSTISLTIFVCLGCSLVFLIIALLNHTFMLPTTLKSWVYIVILGVAITALPIQLLLEGLKYVHPNKASILSVLEPLVTFIVGITVLHEATSLWQVIGAFIVLLGAICIRFER